MDGTMEALASGSGPYSSRGSGMFSRFHPSKKTSLLMIAFLMILIAAIPRLVLLDYSFMPNGVDEGIQIMAGRMVSAGHTIYSEVNTVQAPVMISLYGLMDIGPVFFRVLSVVCSLIIVGMIMYAAYRIAGRDAMVATGAFAAMDLLFIQQSRFASLDMFSLFWVFMGIALYIVYRSKRNRWALLASGILFGISIMTKLFGVIAAGGILMLMTLEYASGLGPVGRLVPVRFLPGEGDRRPLFRDLAVFSLAITLSTLVIMSIFGFQNVVQGVFLNQLHRPSDPLLVRLGAFGVFALCNILAVPFSFLGIRPLYRRTEGVLIVIGALYFVFFLVQGKTWIHHLIFLSPIISLAAGIGAHHAMGMINRKERMDIPSVKGGRARYLLSFLVVMAAILAGSFAVAVSQTGRPPDGSAASIVESLTGPEDYVISGDPMIAILADRPVPPSVVNLAYVQYPMVTDDQLNRTAMEYGVTVIVLTYRLLHMEGFRDFVEANYELKADLHDESLMGDDYELRLIYYLPEGSPLREDPDWGSAINDDALRSS